MPKRILIIGAGVAGLAAGCYGQMNGYETEIFELHNLPGGLCTAWERKDYIFDGCIHYLFGSAPDRPYHRLWRELGAVQGRTFVHHDEFMQVTDGEKTLIAYCDPDRLEAHLLELAPQDAGLVEDLAEGVRQFLDFDMSIMQDKPRALMSPQDGMEMGVKMLGFVPALVSWGNLDATDVARRFKDPFMRRAFPHLFGWSEIPMMAALSLLASMHLHNAGFPVGGSLEFARALERRYTGLGGVIHYNAQVERVLVEEAQAAGVRLYDDREVRGDFVISAADARNTIFHLLDGKYADNRTRKNYDGHLPVRPQVQVSFGVNRDFAATPHWTTHLLATPVVIGGEELDQFGLKHYCFDPTLAPAGKSALEVMLPASYDYWQRIYGRKLYDTEQLQVAGQVLDLIEAVHPGIRADVEVTDVATPLSYERYTGNWQGATCGFLLTKETMRMMIQGVGKTLPGLSNFYLAGQWVEPGGSVSSSAMSGRQAVQLICHQEERDFVTEEAA